MTNKEELVNIFIAFMLPKEASSDMEKVAEDVKELFRLHSLSLSSFPL